MGRSLLRSELAEVLESGTVIGGCKPCREMKWMGWKVFRFEEKTIACTTDSDGDPTAGYEIDPATVDEYTEPDFFDK